MPRDDFARAFCMNHINKDGKNKDPFSIGTGDHVHRKFARDRRFSLIIADCRDGLSNFLLRDIENGVNLPKKFAYCRMIDTTHQF